MLGSSRKGVSCIGQHRSNRWNPYETEVKPAISRDNTLIEITPKYKLERYLILNAINELSFSGIELTEDQMIEFLGISGIGTRILQYDEVETTIREDMMDALALELLGESWPTRSEGLFNLLPPEIGSSFEERLNTAAKENGYIVRSEQC
jgi:hypothetical protein